MDNPQKSWIPTCKEAHALCSERLDRKLGIIDHARLRMHLMICVACANVAKQMDFLHRAMQKMPLDDGEDKKPD
ncbi:MAG: hypothetical protein RL748_3780 [Pseudomonadota bacterium]|jgi:predicted anti-sigma-YlaC factor YlaD